MLFSVSGDSFYVSELYGYVSLYAVQRPGGLLSM